MVRISNVRDWHKIESENRPGFGFQMVTVLVQVYVLHSKLSPFLGISKRYVYFLSSSHIHKVMVVVSPRLLSHDGPYNAINQSNRNSKYTI
jgi:hypothetical protein